MTEITFAVPVVRKQPYARAGESALMIRRRFSSCRLSDVELVQNNFENEVETFPVKLAAFSRNSLLL